MEQKAHVRETAANSEENWMLGKTNRSTGENEQLDLAGGHPWDPAAISQEQEVSLGVGGGEWVPLKVEGWPAPPRGW